AAACVAGPSNLFRKCSCVRLSWWTRASYSVGSISTCVCWPLTDKALLVIDVQKKLAVLLGNPIDDTGDLP
ncbi:hypothetical protein, partial [Pantoea sp. 18069]|uniref:hypothetical protein n=1 Tax=Pantoea sp. 18069 TaxID=2681415 RepID=UPI001F41BB62